MRRRRKRKKGPWKAFVGAELSLGLPIPFDSRGQEGSPSSQE